MRRYLTARFPEAEMVKETGRTVAMLRTRRFLGHGDNQFSRLREAGGDFGPWRPNLDVVHRVRQRTLDRGVKLIVQRKTDLEQLSVRATDPAPPLPDLGANPEVERIHAAVWMRFKGNVRSGGIYVCRYVDGTHTVSKHGYTGTVPPPPWKGAAEDVFIGVGGMPALEEVADFVADETVAGRLHAATVIVNRRIWTRDGGWHVYTGDQHYHTHYDVLGGEPCL